MTTLLAIRELLLALRTNRRRSKLPRHIHLGYVILGGAILKLIHVTVVRSRRVGVHTVATAGVPLLFGARLVVH